MAGNVSLRKIERLSILSFQNALRLHFDAIVLFKNGSYPTAYFISILSLEEIGKYFWLEDLVWHSRIEGRRTPEAEASWILSIFNHRTKQNQVAYQNVLSPFAPKAVREIYEGKLETAKQNSMYVGLPRYKGKVNLNGKVLCPFSVTERKAANQITFVNDFVLVLIAGVIQGSYMVDVPALEDLLTTDLANRLRKAWPQMNASSRRRFKKLVKLTQSAAASRQGF